MDLRKGYWVQWSAAPAPPFRPVKVHFRLGCDFGSRFLQIPHWLSYVAVPPSDARVTVK